MNKDIFNFVNIIGYDKIKLYIFIGCVFVSTFLELSLFYKIGQITTFDDKTNSLSGSLNFISQLPYLNLEITLFSIMLLICAKFLLVKFTGDIAFDFWGRAYQKYFNHILYLNEDKARSNSEYITFLSSKLEVICQTISIPTLTAINSVVYLSVVVFILVWSINYYIVIGVLGLFGLAVVVMYFTRSVFKKISKTVDAEYTSLNKAMQSAISNRMESYVHNYSKDIFSHLSKSVSILKRQKSNTYSYSNSLKIILETVVYCILASIIIMDIPQDIFNLGYVLVIFRSFPHLQALFSLWAHHKSISGLVIDGLSILSIDDKLSDNNLFLNFTSMDKIDLCISSERFKASSLTIYKNKVNILDGESGIGKSSILKELLGVASPSIIQEQKIPNTFPSKIPKISLCSQRAFFLELPIRKIFHLSNKFQISDEKIWSALDLFDLTERITTLDEVLKLDGTSFSGGEMARLSMAIGVSREPDIIVLDESFANLNPSLRKKSYFAVRNAVKTVLMITHDKSFLNGDEIFQTLQ